MNINKPSKTKTQPLTKEKNIRKTTSFKTNDTPYKLGDPITKKKRIVFQNVGEVATKTDNQINAMNKVKNVLDKYL